MPENNPNALGVIEVDRGDAASGYETTSTARSGTTSISSSIQEYLLENGRRYHAYYGHDKNLMPTDEIEQERLDIHHEIMLLTSNRDLYKAPISPTETHRVLDIGTGTGIWSIDYAEQNPNTEVIGMDLSPIQPNWVPPNCRFEVDDFELPWTYPKNSFDFIHARNICHSVKNWSNVLLEVLSHLKPGAWFELAELGAHLFSDDNSMPDNWPPNIAFKTATAALGTLGRIVPTTEWLTQLLENAGFVDVEVKIVKQPMGTWPKHTALKQAGALWLSACEQTYHAYCLSLFTRVLGWSHEDTEAFCKNCVTAHLNKKAGVHAYHFLYYAYGRRPLE